MNPVGVGRARLDGPVAEGRDMRSHPADHRERTGRTDTVSALDAEPESAGPAFGPCEKHLATSDGDRQQIDRHLGKDGGEDRLVILHPIRFRKDSVGTSPPSGRGNHPIDSISRTACGTESASVRNRVAVCPNLGSVFVL